MISWHVATGSNANGEKSGSDSTLSSVTTAAKQRSRQEDVRKRAITPATSPPPEKKQATEESDELTKEWNKPVPKAVLESETDTAAAQAAQSEVVSTAALAATASSVDGAEGSITTRAGASDIIRPTVTTREHFSCTDSQSAWDRL